MAEGEIQARVLAVMMMTIKIAVTMTMRKRAIAMTTMTMMMHSMIMTTRKITVTPTPSLMIVTQPQPFRKSLLVLLQNQRKWRKEWSPQTSRSRENAAFAAHFSNVACAVRCQRGFLTLFIIFFNDGLNVAQLAARHVFHAPRRRNGGLDPNWEPGLHFVAAVQQLAALSSSNTSIASVVHAAPAGTFAKDAILGTADLGFRPMCTGITKVRVGSTVVGFNFHA